MQGFIFGEPVAKYLLAETLRTESRAFWEMRGGWPWEGWTDIFLVML